MDVETLRDSAFVNEKVVLIGIIEDWTPFREESINQEVSFRFFADWELGNEKNIIEHFYKYLDDLRARARFIELVGYNIMRFDIPLLLH